MMLLVDAGNTRIKWILWDKGQLVDRGDLVHKGIELSTIGRRLWGQLKNPSQAIIANVAGPKLGDVLNHWISETWSVQADFVVSEAAGFRVKNAYPVPLQLGVDRWVAMVGAKELIQQSCCIVDCGTAITIDALSFDGIHQGGVIFPGIHLMREALYRDTSQIPQEQSGQTVLLGKNTRDCVWGGTVYAVAAAIDGITERMESFLQGKVHRLLTGGDAEVLFPYLQGNYRLEPDLIFQGLLVIAGQQ